MTRIARVVVPQVPHHVVQRGSRRQRTFFSDDDYQAYLALLAEWAPRTAVRLWSFCLMPNHVHLVVVPADHGGLAACMSQVHRQYARRVNAREDWRGHLWQERFFSVPMDDRHTLAAARYVVMNPVRAGLASTPQEWRYSSIHAHLGSGGDSPIADDAFRGFAIDWQALVSENEDVEATALIQSRTRTGRPAGDGAFMEEMERLTGRNFSAARRGRPKNR